MVSAEQTSGSEAGCCVEQNEDISLKPRNTEPSADPTTNSLLDIHDGDKNGSKRSLEDTPRKLKMIQTLILYSAVFDIALSVCMMGPSLLDLELLTSSDTATIAMVFVGRACGSLAGNVLSGFMIDKINHWLLITLNKLLSALFTVLIPLCRSVPALVICAVPAGVMTGFADAGCNYVILLIWGKNNGPIMQGFHFLFGIGCMLAPLVVAPFLKNPEETANINQTENRYNNSSFYSQDNATLGVDIMLTPDSASDIIYGFSIASAMATITCVSSFAMFLHGDRTILTRKKSSPKTNEDGTGKRHINLGLWLMFLGILFTFYLAICGLEIGMSAYLLTFAVKHSGWTKSQGAHVTSVFLGAFTVGRGLGILIIAFVRPTIILFTDLAICMLFSIIMVIFVNMHMSVLWVCAIGLGFGMSTIFAAGFTWTESYIGVNPMATTVMLVGAAVGEMLTPVLIGQLFDKVSQISYTYIILGFSSLSLIFMSLLLFAAWKVKPYFSEKNISMNERSDIQEDKSDAL